MKLRVILKDPDALIDCLEDAYDYHVEQYINLGLSKRAAQGAAQADKENMYSFASKYFRYSEYITIEFDDKEETVKII